MIRIINKHHIFIILLLIYGIRAAIYIQRNEVWTGEEDVLKYMCHIKPCLLLSWQILNKINNKKIVHIQSEMKGSILSWLFFLLETLTNGSPVGSWFKAIISFSNVNAEQNKTVVSFLQKWCFCHQAKFDLDMDMDWSSCTQLNYRFWSPISQFSWGLLIFRFQDELRICFGSPFGWSIYLSSDKYIK